MDLTEWFAELDERFLQVLGPKPTTVELERAMRSLFDGLETSIRQVGGTDGGTDPDIDDGDTDIEFRDGKDHVTGDTDDAVADARTRQQLHAVEALRVAVKMLTAAQLDRPVKATGPEAAGGPSTGPHRQTMRDEPPRRAPTPFEQLGRGFGRLLPGASPPRPPAPPPPVPAPRLTADLDRARRALRGAFEAIDRLLVEADPPPPEVVSLDWADDKDLLGVLQDLLTASQSDDAELALGHVRRFQQLGERHGIMAVLWDQENELLFSFEANIDPEATEDVTVAPALVDPSGRLLLLGRALIAAGDDPEHDDGGDER